MDWKAVSRKLVNLHDEKEAGIIRLTPHSTGEMVNLSNEYFCLEVKGRELTAKRVRKFLWEHRKKRALQRKKAVVWSAYVEEEDMSYVGVGALTSPEVAARMRGE